MKGIIFDMDGVLTDSSPIHEWAFRETLRPYGIVVDYRRIAGMRTRDAIAILLAENGIHDAELERLAAAKSEAALRRMREENPVVPGALDVVERLSAKYPIALASSGSRESVDAFLELNCARPLFRAVLSGGDIKAAKPEPDIYLEAARRLGISSRDCLVVEDSISGAQAATAAGAQVAMVTASVDSLSSLLQHTVSACDVPEADDIRRFASGPRHREQWTAIIPAAGRGTRLGFDLPKILYPVAGRTILEWLARLLRPICARVIVVASPEGAPVISRRLDELLPGQSEVAVQAEPRGMADAIQSALPQLRTTHALIVWGDQAALKPESLDVSVRLHENAAPLATVPTAMRDKPYIHFERDSSNRVIRVLQAREGDTMPATGESDCGVFFFRSIALRRLLAELQRNGAGMGGRTGEFNFLPALPLAGRLAGSLLTPRIMTEEESIGVNSRQDAEILAGVLLARGAGIAGA
jgi:bifunctional UDP-N-acetylglucosamine pyrophosphorylase / glucosamine-1-phosphate N-acetyltransferase